MVMLFIIPNISPTLVVKMTAILNLSTYSFDPLVAGNKMTKMDITALKTIK
jgi:hypothetical protein